MKVIRVNSITHSTFLHEQWDTHFCVENLHAGSLGNSSIFLAQVPKGTRVPLSRTISSPRENFETRYALQWITSLLSGTWVSSRRFINFTSASGLLTSPATVWGVENLWARNSTMLFLQTGQGLHLNHYRLRALREGYEHLHILSSKRNTLEICFPFPYSTSL